MKEIGKYEHLSYEERSTIALGLQQGRVPTRGVSPQPGQAETHGTQRATALSRVGTVSQRVCKPSSCI